MIATTDLKEGSTITGWLTEATARELRARGLVLSFIQFDRISRLPIHRVVRR